MNKEVLDPYSICPVYDTRSFTLRLVRPEDAVDLLRCYSDPESIPLFNSDNCRYGFSMHKLDDMRNCIEAWLQEYRERRFVRFSIIDKQLGRAIGTIEFFTRTELSADVQHEIAIMRLDLESGYERTAEIDELLELIETRFSEIFTFTSLLTKAVPEATARTGVLFTRGYKKVERSTSLPYNNYYMLGS